MANNDDYEEPQYDRATGMQLPRKKKSGLKTQIGQVNPFETAKQQAPSGISPERAADNETFFERLFGSNRKRISHDKDNG